MGAQWIEYDADGKFALENANAIVVLPLGATEQHGPHLSTDTDWIIAEGLCNRLICEINKKHSELDVYFLPVEKIGYSPEHIGLKIGDGKDATKSLEYDEAIERWIEIGRQLKAKDVKKLVFLNAHGGNSPLLAIVAQELRVRHDMLVVVTKWTRFIKDLEGVVEDPKQQYDIHAGEIETSVMMVLEPDEVEMDEAVDFLPTFGKKSTDDDKPAFNHNNTHLRPFGPHAYGWKMSDLNKNGALGNAKAAEKKTGEKLLNAAVDGFVKLLAEVDQFELAFLSMQDQPSTGNPGYLDKAKPFLLLLTSRLLEISVLLNVILLTLSWLGSLSLLNGLSSNIALSWLDNFSFKSNLAATSNILFSSSYAIPFFAVVSSLASIYALLKGDRYGTRSTIAAMTIQTVLLAGIFAAVYHDVGIINAPYPMDSWTAVYFSIVTWTTLGYGDLQPVATLQLLAAMEATTGYLFLGSIVGVVASRLMSRPK